MTHNDPSRTPPRRTASIVVGGLLVVAASAVGLGLTQQVSSSPTTASPTSSSAVAVASPVSSPATAVVPTTVLPRDQRGELGAPGTLPEGPGVAIGAAGGVLPNRATAFDERVPGIARLDAALLDALQHASTEAKRKGVRLYVASGWRSQTYQEQLFRRAVTEYGSEAEAARWVAMPGSSSHEWGDAVDIGPADAVAWLSKQGAAYGLCQIYRNEPWHYELRPGAIDRGCPPMYADPTDDPRLQP